MCSSHGYLENTPEGYTGYTDTAVEGYRNHGYIEAGADGYRLHTSTELYPHSRNRREKRGYSRDREYSSPAREYSREREFAKSREYSKEREFSEDREHQLDPRYPNEQDTGVKHRNKINQVDFKPADRRTDQHLSNSERRMSVSDRMSREERADRDGPITDRSPRDGRASDQAFAADVARREVQDSDEQPPAPETNLEDTFPGHDVPDLPVRHVFERRAKYDPRNFSFRLKDRESVVVEQGRKLQKLNLRKILGN